jgi:hypothetical protein
MTRITVTSCSDCPFEDDGDGRPFCKADDEQRGTDPSPWEAVRPSGRPDWCPLELGQVTVMVPTAGGVLRGWPAWTMRGRLRRTCGGCATARGCYNSRQCSGAPGTEVSLDDGAQTRDGGE